MELQQRGGPQSPARTPDPEIVDGKSVPKNSGGHWETPGLTNAQKLPEVRKQVEGREVFPTWDVDLPRFLSVGPPSDSYASCVGPGFCQNVGTVNSERRRQLMVKDNNVLTQKCGERTTAVRHIFMVPRLVEFLMPLTAQLSVPNNQCTRCMRQKHICTTCEPPALPLHIPSTSSAFTDVADWAKYAPSAVRYVDV